MIDESVYTCEVNEGNVLQKSAPALLEICCKMYFCMLDGEEFQRYTCNMQEE